MENIHPIFDHVLDRSSKEKLLNQKGCVLWLYGLSGAGNSTLATALEKQLHSEGIMTQLLDGDNIRTGLNKGLGFSDEDRLENIRRIAEVAKLMMDAGVVVLTAFISPFRTERDMARAMFDEGEFVEVYVNTPLEIAESRDPKGLYKKARRGELPHFTGIDSPYESPMNPEIELSTENETVDEIVKRLVKQLEFR